MDSVIKPAKSRSEDRRIRHRVTYRKTCKISANIITVLKKCKNLSIIRNINDRYPGGNVLEKCRSCSEVLNILHVLHETFASLVSRWNNDRTKWIAKHFFLGYEKKSQPLFTCMSWLAAMIRRDRALGWIAVAKVFAHIAHPHKSFWFWLAGGAPRPKTDNSDSSRDIGARYLSAREVRHITS